ncbi:hypothetical protein GC170_20435 [bacterium]|nr:hypothetical protein [bacterium]
MAVKSSTYNLTVETTTEWSVGSTLVNATTQIGDSVKFTNGTGAGQFTDVIEASLNANGSPVTLSSLSTPQGTAGSTFTKLKGVGFFNPSTNAAITFTSSVTGLHAGKIEPGATFFVPYPSAAGLTVSGASTFTATGTTGQFLRMILLLA